MFKKFKDKLTEEMKQSPARLQASMQQLAQAVVSPSVSNTSIQSLSASNDNFSLTEDGDETTPKNSPSRHGFQNVDLTTPSPITRSRRSSISSVTSIDNSSMFPIDESPAGRYNFQSDMDASASEADDDISANLDRVSKEQIYSAYKKVQGKYHKYRGRYTDLAKHYRELERSRGKLETLLVETQDKASRKITELREQCQLEKQAKAHLEQALRNDIEEKDHVIDTLNTKVAPTPDQPPIQQQSQEELLVDLSPPPEPSNDEKTQDNPTLKAKFEKLEILLTKYKESLRKSKERLGEVIQEKSLVERDLELLKQSSTEKFKILEDDLNLSREEIQKLNEQLGALKRREEESAISLAENKLSIHRELEEKEEQIKKLTGELQSLAETKESLQNEVKLINKNKEDELSVLRAELENFKENNNKQGEIDALTSKIQVYTAALQKAKERIDAQAQKIRELSENSKEGELEEKTVELLGLQSEVKSCRTTIGDLKESLKKNSEDVGQLRKEKTCLIANILDYKKKIEVLKENCEGIAGEVEDFKKVGVEMVKEMEGRLGELLKSIDGDKEEKSKELEEVEELREKIRFYENEIKEKHDRSKEIEELNDKIKLLEEQVGNKNREIEEIREKFDRSKEIEELESKIRLYEGEIEELREKSDKSKEIEELNSKIRLYEGVIEELREKSDRSKEIEELNMKIQSYEAEIGKNSENLVKIEELNSKVALLTQQIHQKDAEIHEMRDKVEKYDETTKQNNKLIAEIDNLNFKIHDFSKIRDQLQQNAHESTQQITKELNSLKEKCENYVRELNDALEKSNSLELENIELRKNEEELIRLRNDCENYSKLFAENLEKLKKFEEENENLKINFAEAEENFEKFRRDVSTSEEERSKCFNEEITKKTALIEEKNCYYQDLQEKYNNQSEELSQLRVQFEIHRKMLEESQEQSRLFQEEISSKEKYLEIEEENKNKLKHNLKEAEDNLKVKTNENEETLKSLRSLEECLEKVEREKEENLKSLKTLEAENESLKLAEEEKLKLEKTLISKNELIDKLKNLKNKQTKAIQELESKNELLKSSENSAKQQLEVMSEMEDKMAVLLKENGDLKLKIQEIEEERSKFEAERREFEILKEKVMNLEGENKKFEDEVKNLEEVRETLAKAEENLKIKVESLEKLNLELKGEIEELRNSFEMERKERLAEKEKMIQELQEKESWTTKVMEELKQHSEKLESDLEKYRGTEIDGNPSQRTTEERLEEDRLRKLIEELQGQLQEMESKLITSQAKESQLEIISEDMKSEIKRLQLSLETSEKENSIRMSQLVKELQAQLHDKDEQLQAALNQKFDRQQNYESELIQQYKEQLKDFQIELTRKSEEIESLRGDQKEVQRLMETISNIKKEHANELRELEQRLRTSIKQKSEQLEMQEKEWQKDKFNNDQVEDNHEELENMSRVAMAAVQSNTGSFHSLQQTLVSQRRELAELRKIVKLRQDTLEDSTEIEYLRNILYEYMMGRETLVLARVIAAVVKFDQDQTNKILKKEEDKLTLLGSLGLT